MSQVKIAERFPYLLEQLVAKLRDYTMLMKMRLLLLVVFSSLSSYFILAYPNWVLLDLLLLTFGGIAVAGSANALNQVLEKDFDALMKRTKNRPLPANRMSITEAIFVAGVLALLGTVMLMAISPLVAVVGAISLFFYAFVYTPLKRVTSFSVFVGAIPGALPVIIGGLASEDFGIFELVLLFGIQFFWQFPHFWAIAWSADEEYKKAGYYLLPSVGSKKDTTVGKLSFIYSLMLIPISIGLFFYLNLGVLTLVILIGLCLYYTYYAYQFWMKSNDVAARKLMFSSFIYLPLYLITVLIDQMVFLG